jgi:hypothetical protein
MEEMIAEIFFILSFPGGRKGDGFRRNRTFETSRLAGGSSVSAKKVDLFASARLRQ